MRLKGSTSGFRDVLGKEMNGSEGGKVRRVAQEKVVELMGWKGSFG